MLKFRILLIFGYLNIFYVLPLCSEQIYNWVDNNGIKNYSNLPSNVPDNLFVNYTVDKDTSLHPTEYVSKYDLEQQRKDYFLRLKKLQAQRNLINEIRDIVKREQILQDEFDQKQKMAIETKRDFDRKIIQGYFAENSIIELRKYEVDMENINDELRMLKPRRDRLISIAKKQGINRDI